MIYNKSILAGLLLASSAVCQASSSKRSELIRGAQRADRGLEPSGGKGKGKGAPKVSKKSKNDDPFANPKGREVCSVSFEIQGPTTAIPAANNPLPAGYSFADCNQFLTEKSVCQPANPISCLTPAPPSDYPFDIDGYYGCLVDKGVINGPWFFHPDTPGSQFRFTNVNGGTNGSQGSACSKITSALAAPLLKPKAEIEFRSKEFFGTKLADLISFSVDYKVVTQSASPTNQYFVNIYTRVNSDRDVFYDCNFGFIPDQTAPTAPTDWKSFPFDLNTPLDSKRSCAIPTTGPNPCLVPALDCSTFDTLGAFVTAYPDAVIGVGANDSTETINLVTGETGSSYIGLEVCWDNIQIATKKERFQYDFEAASA